MSNADLAKVFIEYGKDAAQYVRHYEDIRFKFSQLTITLAAALVGLERFGSSKSPWIIPTLVILVGVVGVFVTFKYTERADRHARIARQLRLAVSAMSTEPEEKVLEVEYQKGSSVHKSDTSITLRFYRVRAR